jgi:hypothetical protein
MTETTTLQITGQHTHRALRFLPETVATVTENGQTSTITTGDLDALIAAIPAAKETQVNEYLRAGGNRRNVRAFASTWTAIRKAVEAAR